MKARSYLFRSMMLSLILSMMVPCLTLSGIVQAVPAARAEASSMVSGDFGLRLNGLMTTARPIHVVADGPADAKYYDFYLRTAAGSWECRGNFTYPADFWIYPARYNMPSAYTSPMLLEVYAFSDSGVKLGTAYAEFLLYPESQVLVMPEDLVRIEAQAFAGTTAERVDMQYEVTTIGARAFANCTDLTSIRLSSALKSIDDTAFSGCRSDLLIEAAPASLGAQFAEENGYPFLPIYEPGD